MSSVVRGPAQRVSKSLSSSDGVRLYTAATIEAAFTEVSPSLYTIPTAAALASALPLTALATLEAKETLKDMGATITVTALDTGAQVVFQRVQRTLPNFGAGAVGYVVVRNEAEVNATVLPSRS
jgi:hypothetical protein